MRTIKLTRDTKALIRAPANPMPHELSATLGELMADYPDVLEAHLPYCFPDAMEKPDQILVAIFKSFISAETTLQSIGSRLPNVLPADMELLVLPLDETDPLCRSVRSPRCQIYAKGKSR